MLQIRSDEYHGRTTVDALLRDIALQHCANDTAFLDFFEGSPPAHRALVPVSDEAFCDTLILFVIVPEYHIIAPGMSDGADGTTASVHRVSKATMGAIRQDVQQVFQRQDISIQLSHKSIMLQNLSPLFPRGEGATGASGGDGGGPSAASSEEGERAQCEKQVDEEDRRKLQGDLQDPSFKHVVIPHRIPSREEEIKEEGNEVRFYTQQLRVALPNHRIEDVLELAVRSDRLAREGFYLLELDVTVDCAGTFRKWPSTPTGRGDEPPAVVPTLLETAGFRMQATAQRWGRMDKTILDNDAQVSRNTLTYVAHSRHVKVSTEKRNALGEGAPLHVMARSKGYSKPCDNVEKRTLRSRSGHNIQTTQNVMFDPVAMAFDATRGAGYTRIETTFASPRPYAKPSLNRLDMPLDKAVAWAALKSVIDVFPEECILKTPHETFWLNWCKNVHHSLVVVDALTDAATVVCAVNTLTRTVAATSVTKWSTKYRYVLERMTLGATPIDVITVHRGKAPPKPSKATPRKRHSRASQKSRKRARGDGDAAQPPAKRARAVTWSPEVEFHSRDCERHEAFLKRRRTDSLARSRRRARRSERANTLDVECAYHPADYTEPDDPGGCLVMSERFLRMPRDSEEVHDGVYLPETRFHSDKLGKGFQPGPAPEGWNDDGSKTGSLVLIEGEMQMAQNAATGEMEPERIGTRPETYSDEQLAGMTTQRSGMEANKLIRAENWPNLNPRARPEYADILRARRSRLPLDARSFLRKDADAERETRDDRLRRLQASAASAEDERAQLLDTRVYDLSLRGSVKELKRGCQAANGAGFSASELRPGEHDVVAFELITTDAEENMQLKLHLAHARDDPSGPDTRAYCTPRCVSDAVRDAQHHFSSLSYRAAGSDGGNLFFLKADRTRIATITVPRASGIHASRLMLSDPEVRQLFPIADGSSEEREEREEREEGAGGEGEGEEGEQLDELEASLVQRPSLFSDIVSLRIDPGAELHVVSAATTLMKYRHADRWLLKVRVNDGEDEVLLMANKRIIELKDRVARGAILRVDKIYRTGSDFAATIVRPHEWWLRFGPYDALPALRRSMQDPPACLDIEAAARVPNRRGDSRNPVVQMRDRRVYRFERPQDAHTLSLCSGRTLDLATWSTHTTP